MYCAQMCRSWAFRFVTVSLKCLENAVVYRVDSSRETNTTVRNYKYLDFNENKIDRETMQHNNVCTTQQL